ncbi:LVIVD repeat-containing protein [Oceanibium sediminis]|uniref:LVIVD repeat-containing protein n=1 Tax=Oceanibium sediminis TaxID=2026339 RepID=UPI000DD38FF3|nr:hypothetical protein [Oceanibium sediminis]
MGSSLNAKLLSHVDCPGGGQVWVENNILYIGHMRNPSGTTIVDVADPRNPKVIARIEVPDGWHSHKVRVSKDGLMLVNHEKLGPNGDWEFGGGLTIYDVTRPDNPRQIHKWITGGRGVHRFDFDGRYAYISPTVDGYIGNIAMILDLDDPTNPQEVGRWWVPGQHIEGGEEADWLYGVTPRCHHPIRRGNRLYTSYWHEGLFILDIEDMSKPKLISSVNTSAAFPHPTHTCLPFPQKLKGRDVMVVADEDVAKLYPAAPAFTWIYDITDETNPIPISTFQVEGLDKDGSPQDPMMGCHQPSERFEGTIIPFAWFAQGMRLVDFADPFAPKEVGHFLPDAPAGSERPSSNDVTIDDRGIIYLIDRVHGVDIIETSVF